MNPTILTVFALLVALPSWGQSKPPTLAQCQDVAGYLQLTSKEKMQRTMDGMTAGDELVFSTKLENCLSHHWNDLSGPQLRAIVETDAMMTADVMGRMTAFLEKNHLLDKFNDDEEAEHHKEGKEKR